MMTDTDRPQLAKLINSVHEDQDSNSSLYGHDPKTLYYAIYIIIGFIFISIIVLILINIII